MILVEISEAQREFVKEEALLSLENDDFWGLWNRVHSGVEYQGQFMCELSPRERTWLNNRVCATMEDMRADDVNSWVSGKYASLENLLYGLYVGCAE